MQLTDAGLCELTTLELLERLDIGGCVAVSVRGIAALARSLHHLTCLKVGALLSCPAGLYLRARSGLACVCISMVRL